MTEENVFVYELYLSLNISGLFFMVKTATHPKKKLPPLSKQPSSKNRDPPFLKISSEAQPLPPVRAERRRGGGAHFVYYLILFNSTKAKNM